MALGKGDGDTSRLELKLVARHYADRLDHVVELVERQESRDQDASPDWWLDVREGDLELIGDRPVQARGAGPFVRCMARHRGVDHSHRALILS